MAIAETARTRLQVSLASAWWLLFPGFLGLTIVLSSQRACADAYDLLPRLAASTRSALLLALVYALAHAWVATAYVFTVSQTDRLFPALREYRELWRSDVTKLVLMLAAFCVEYAPIHVLRILGHAAGCTP